MLSRTGCDGWSPQPMEALYFSSTVRVLKLQSEQHNKEVRSLVLYWTAELTRSYDELPTTWSFNHYEYQTSRLIQRRISYMIHNEIFISCMIPMSSYPPLYQPVFPNHVDRSCYILLKHPAPFQHDTFRRTSCGCNSGFPFMHMCWISLFTWFVVWEASHYPTPPLPYTEKRHNRDLPQMDIFTDIT